MHRVEGLTALNAGAVAAPRLVKAAHEFEAQMMKELLKPMTESGLSDGDEEDAGSGILREFASEAFGQALSEHGGLGIAKSILGNLGKRGEAASGSAASETGTGSRSSVALND